MKLADYLGYEIHVPTSGGKAGKGKAQTGSIQVRRGGMIQAQFRFRWVNDASRKRAIRKAKEFCTERFADQLKVA